MRSKTWVAASHWLELRVRVPTGTWMLVVSVVYHIEVSASERSLVQKNSTECDVSECHHEASIIRNPDVLRSLGHGKNITSIKCDTLDMEGLIYTI